jgi:hypothetical protein
VSGLLHYCRHPCPQHRLGRSRTTAAPPLVKQTPDAVRPRQADRREYRSDAEVLCWAGVKAEQRKHDGLGRDCERVADGDVDRAFSEAGAAGLSHAADPRAGIAATPVFRAA